MLDKYAALIVKVGLNLQAGQHLMIVNPPLSAEALVHAVTKEAYQAGARLVSVLWHDETIRKLQLQYGSREALEAFPDWWVEAIANHARNGEAQLVINGRNPDLFKGEDPDAVKIMNRARNQHMKAINELVTIGAMNWCHVSVPVPAWAQKVFPDLSADEAVRSLWNLMYKVCRLDQDDPVAAWNTHIQTLGHMADYLNQKRYSALHYQADGTDLTVGLPENHIWLGGAATMSNGISCVPNIPTEEVFTMPHKDKVNGYVRSTKPFVFQGRTIENFTLKIEAGRVIHAEAETGDAELTSLLKTDEGASRLGEIALVSKNSPVGQSGLIFHNMLYDENGSSHLAIGRAFRVNMQDGQAMSDEEFFAAGGNDSLIHADFMIGSDNLSVDGITENGEREPIFRNGDRVI